MPLILPPEAVDTWLTGTPDQAKALLVPYPSEMRAHRVSKRVNAPRNDDPELIAPVELETEQQALQLN
jgi:putative SOS response-associated peptidase YedK